MEKNYASVSISSELIEEINKFIDSEESTYTTKADFIRDAIRMRLRELGVKI
jgi:metal-responsive CopG/Arc/MetJ family transcriptional regulator